MNASPYIVADRPFPQKVASHLILPGGRHPNDVRAIAQTTDGTVWLGTAHGLFSLQGDNLSRVDDDLIGCPDVKHLTCDGDGLWVGTGLGLASRSSEGAWTIRLSDLWTPGSVTATISTPAGLWIATSSSGLHRVDDGAIAPLEGRYPEGKQIYGFADRQGELLIYGEAGVSVLSSDLSTIGTRWLEDLQIRDILTDGSITYYATSGGLYKQDGASAPRRVDTPIRDIHALAHTRLGLGMATSSGVCIHAADRWHYLAGPRWLPSDDARALLQDGDTLLIATGNGLGRVSFVDQTLEAKEPGFEQRIRDRHLRLKGFVTTSRLETAGDLTSNCPVPSDNDGLWTALYLAAQSYRYAVTGNEEALAWANQAFDAIEWLEAVTTVDGFPTKAIVSKDEDTGSDAVPWYPSADGKWLWKGDCSSDEIDGHMYGYAIFYDLAADESHKARIVSLVDRIMDHIIGNGYLLIGKDGERTRWGVWAPEYLNGPWRAQRGLNSLEILSHLKTAHHITGEDRYDACYRDLIDNHGYAENARHVKLRLPGHVNHSDDELAFISYYPLLKYETDPGLREIYLESLEDSWTAERPERNPWWNYIYGAITQKACDADLAAETLRQIPTDLVDWPIRNSHRLDVTIDTERGRKGELQSVGVLPYDELPASKWNLNPYNLDADSTGHREDDGTYYLLPYWMGRHYGFLTKGVG